jgi:glycosyltransferase 2 family protein
VNKRILWTALKYLLAAALLTWVVWKNWGYPENPDDRGLGYIWQRHVVHGEPIHYVYLSLAFLFFALAVPITFVRWWVLVRAQDLPFTLGSAFRLGVLGLFYSTFLPGSVGGDLVKAFGIAREQSRRTVAVATVIMDRIMGLWGLCWIVALLGAAFWLNGALDGGQAEAPSKLIVGCALGLVASSTAGWLLLGLLSEAQAVRLADRLERLPKVGGSAAEFWRAVWMYRRRQASVFLALLLSFVGFLGFVPSFYFGAHALGDAAPNLVPTLTQHFLLVPIGLVVQAAVPLPGGVGASEYGFGKLFGWFGCPEPNGVLASLVARVVTWTIGLLGYLVVVGMARKELVVDAKTNHESTKDENTKQKQRMKIALSLAFFVFSSFVLS